MVVGFFVFWGVFCHHWKVITNSGNFRHCDYRKNLGSVEYLKGPWKTNHLMTSAAEDDCSESHFLERWILMGRGEGTHSLAAGKLRSRTAAVCSFLYPERFKSTGGWYLRKHEGLSLPQCPRESHSWTWCSEKSQRFLKSLLDPGPAALQPCAERGGLSPVASEVT